MSAVRFRAVLFALLSVSCFTESDEPDPVPVYPACPALPACNQGAEPAFSFVTLHRAWGPDRDEASYRFVLDEQACTLSKAGAVCTVGDAPDDGSVPLFVSADVAPTGVGRMFRVDTFGRASAHLRIERDGVLVDEFDHVPTLTSQGCPAFVFDAEARRDLPEPPQKGYLQHAAPRLPYPHTNMTTQMAPDPTAHAPCLTRAHVLRPCAARGPREPLPTRSLS